MRGRGSLACPQRLWPPDAGPVAAETLKAITRAPVGEGALAGERLGWFVRPGGHSTTVYDWRAWLDYADRWL